MKPFSITAPEEVAKEYGGDKRKIQQAAAQGLIDPTSAVLAGMFIDRIRGAAAAEQAPQATVAEQVMNPQPQMPSAGLAATPQAAQMQQPMVPQMPQPGAPRMPQPAPPQMAQAPQMPPQQPMGMAMGGGLDSIDFVEQGYAPGGLVSFQVGGGYGETMAQLRRQLGAARTQAQRDQIQGAMNQLRAQYEQPSLQPNLSTGPAREGLAAVDTSDPMATGMETFADNTPAQSQRIDPNRFNTGTLTEAEARRIEAQPEGGLMSALSSMFAPAATTGEIPIDRSGQRAELGGRDITMPGIGEETGQTDGLTLAEIGRRIKRSVVGVPGTETIDPEGALVTGLSGRDSADVNAYQSAPGRVNTYGPLEDQAGAARQTAQQETAGLTAAANQFVEQPEDKNIYGDRAATTQAAPTISLTDAIEQTNKAVETGAVDPKTAATTQASAVDELLDTSEPTDTLTKIQGLLKPAEKGEFRKETEALIKNREGRLKEAKNEAFSMALLQAGLGMLGQGGGQTALQALGKAALPAVKDAAASIKDAKKEDRELLQLGLAMEQMDDKQRTEVNKVLAQQVGEDERNRLLRKTQVLTTKMNVDGRIQEAKINAASAARSMNVAAMESAAGRITSELGTMRQLANESLTLNRPYLDASKQLTDAQERLASKPDDPKRQQKVADLESKLSEIRSKALREGGFTQSISELEEIRDRLNSRLTGGSIGATGTSTQATPLPANPTAATLQKGTVYQTARGPARWNGQAFEAVQ